MIGHGVRTKSRTFKVSDTVLVRNLQMVMTGWQVRFCKLMVLCHMHIVKLDDGCKVHRTHLRMNITCRPKMAASVRDDFADDMPLAS